MKFLKKEGFVILGCLLLSALGAFGLSFIIPDLNAKQLFIISAILLVVLYLLIKIGSFLLKILLLVGLVVVLFYFIYH